MARDDLDDATASCALPGCNEPRIPEFLGWHEDDPITSAYCEYHGPAMKVRRCSECGSVQSSRLVWPDGIPPAGVLNGKVGSVSVR